MKTQRFYKLVILALVLLNVSIMVFFWVNRPPKPPRPGAHQIATMLGLKGEEKRKVDLLEREHHKEKRKLVHKDMDLHDQLFSSFGDKDKSDSLLMVIDKNKSKI